MWKAIQTDKKAYVASVLNLTPAEAKKFWPIYDQYQRDLERFVFRSGQLMQPVFEAADRKSVV